MRRKHRWTIFLISAAVGGIGILLALFLRSPACPIELRVVHAEPNPMIYFGQAKANVLTLTAKNVDIVDVTYDVPSFEVNVEGQWTTYDRPQPFALMAGPGFGWGGGINRMSAGAKREEKFVVPENAAACRVRVRYYSDTWKWRLKARLGPMGERWVARSPWLSKKLSPDPIEAMQMQPWKTNTVELVIPRSVQNN